MSPDPCTGTSAVPRKLALLPLRKTRDSSVPEARLPSHERVWLEELGGGSTLPTREHRQSRMPEPEPLSTLSDPETNRTVNGVPGWDPCGLSDSRQSDLGYMEEAGLKGADSSGRFRKIPGTLLPSGTGLPQGQGSGNHVPPASTKR